MEKCPALQGNERQESRVGGFREGGCKGERNDVGREEALLYPEPFLHVIQVFISTLDIQNP